MKNIIVFFICLISTFSSAFAAELVKAELTLGGAYLIVTNYPAQKVYTSNDKLFKVEILTTIYNEKDKILVKVAEKGSGKIYIETEKDTVVLEIKAGEKDVLPDVSGTVISDMVAIDIIKSGADAGFELDKPPVLNQEAGAK